ncbi:MAG: universal stress protein [Deltaproteobacteria bacterium]|nr:universal stress protein [Deltaproteobacteria bacterium]
MEDLTKKVIIPVDGSKNALKSLKYLDLVFKMNHNLDVDLVYITPSLTSAFGNEPMDKETYTSLSIAEKKIVNKGERILQDAKNTLVKMGFDEERIKTVSRKKQIGISQDICVFAESTRVDAVLVTRRSHTDLETFFMGRVTDRLVEQCKNAPVWIVGGSVDSKKVLICVDRSGNALRAVDHVGFMLSGTDCQITLFNTMRDLKRMIPKEVVEEAPELEKLWEEKAAREVGETMKKAKAMLIEAGIPEEQISKRVVQGSRSPGDDIIKEAKQKGYGTIVMGRRGISGFKEFVFGSVTKKILNQATGFVVWIVQ